MSKAYDMARRVAEWGWKVFPVKAGAKAPPLIRRWQDQASSDTDQLYRWHTIYPGCNWGVACGPSDLTVLDVDPRHGGEETLAGFHDDWETQLPDTISQATPSFGTHLIYRGATPKSSAGKLGPGIDTRSTGGYIVLAGSRVGDREYTWANLRPDPLDIQPTPDWIRERLGQAHERAEDSYKPVAELDTEQAIAQAHQYLLNEARIDIPAFLVAAQVKDLGISQETCLRLMWEDYAPRCEAPWALDVLAKKVDNAYKYGQNPPGITSPELISRDFQPFEIEPEPLIEPIKIRHLGGLLERTLPPRPWILGRRYLKGYVTVTVAPGGLGKSSLVMLEAASIASGRPLTGQPVHKKGRVWIYNTEEPYVELERRMQAVGVYYGLSDEDMRSITMISGRDRRLLLAKQSQGQVLVDQAEVRQIIRTIREEDILALFVDPFVRCHAVSENDNSAIDQVAQVLSHIAQEGDCAVSICHHTRKGPPTPGNADSARGASSLVSAVRVAHTLTTMSEREATLMRIPDKRRLWYVRLDDAKVNMAPPGAEVEWFRRISVDLPGSKEPVGTLEPYQAGSEVLNEEDQRLVDLVFTAWNEPISCFKMAGIIKENAPEFKDIARSSVTSRLIKLFDSQVREGPGGQLLTAEWRTGSNHKRARLIVEVGVNEE